MKWFSCTLCIGRRCHIKDTAGLARHNKAKHSTTGNQPTVLAAPTSHPTETQLEARLPTFDGGMTPAAFSREESRLYFEKEHNSHNGIDHIMGRAFLDRDIGDAKLDDTEMEFAITLSDLAQKISRSECFQLADIVRLVEKIVRDRCNEDDPVHPELQLKLPKNGNCIRKAVLDDQSRLSVRSNLPYPRVFTTPNHAYINLRCVVQDYICHNGPFEKLLANRQDEVNHPRNSERACALAGAHNDGPTLMLGLYDWGDDGDMANTLKDRNSVHCRSVTILVPPKDAGGPGSHISTYPLSLSLKGADHDEVECIFADEIASFDREPLVCYSPSSCRPACNAAGST